MLVPGIVSQFLLGKIPNLNLHFLVGSMDPFVKNQGSNSRKSEALSVSLRYCTFHGRNGGCRWCIHCIRVLCNIPSGSPDLFSASILLVPFRRVKIGCTKLRWACPFLRRSTVRSPSNRDNDLTCAFAHQLCYPRWHNWVVLPVPVTISTITCFVGDTFFPLNCWLITGKGDNLSHTVIPFRWHDSNVLV